MTGVWKECDRCMLLLLITVKQRWTTVLKIIIVIS